jgi:hypothetical protein
VWLASYPRSGSTWVRAVLTVLTAPRAEPTAAACQCHGDPWPDINLLAGGPMAGSRPAIDAVIGFASGDLLPSEIDALRPACDAAMDATFNRVTVRKIHDALFSGPGGRPIVDPTITRAAIYLVRDPRDVAVSLAAFYERSLAWAVNWIADPAAALNDSPSDLGTQVRQRLGSWSGHLAGWTHHGLFDVEVFRYEDLHADPLGQFARLAAVAGLPASATEIGAAVAAARFHRLRAQELRHGFRERPAANRAFFRRGVVGGWRDELPADLARQIERDHGATMTHLGYLRDAIAVSGV